MYSAYSATLIDFLAADPAALVGQLHEAIASEGFSRQWTSQTSAWHEVVAVLQRVAGDLIELVPESKSWTILLEYEIARRGRRIDAVLLLNRAVIVLEFKVGVDLVDSASRWQVLEYALDLRDFHTESGSALIIPILVPTTMTSTVTPEIMDSTANFSSGVQDVINCAPDQLTSLIARLNGAVLQQANPMLDQDAWCKASYRPKPKYHRGGGASFRRPSGAGNLLRYGNQLDGHG
jgi:tRNA(Arg) A34 adenosine deaminase TadA